MTQKVSVDERRRLVAESLQVGNPGNNARDLPSKGDAFAAQGQVEHQISLNVDEIRSYENNPRRCANAKFDDIKESIRTSGLRSPLTVTRRPGESHFIVEAGGNTRLLALQQLWSETRDPRYRQLVVLFRPWRSESHVLTAHLIENEQRGEMSFWDKASGVVALKRQLEEEQGRPLTLRPLEDALYAVGLAVNTATLGHYLFATERLRTLGEAVVGVNGLKGLDVKSLQPRLNAIKRYAMARQTLSEDAVYATVFEPVFKRIADKYPHTGEFSVAATCEACEVAMATHLGESVDVLRGALRPVSARSGQGDERPVGNDIMPTESATGAVASIQNALRPAPEADDLLGRIQAFADIAGVGDCVEVSPMSSAGFRLSSGLEEGAAEPGSHRAWCLLAGISGQADVQARTPLVLDPEFITWLADPLDASSTAFWDLLTFLRNTGARISPSDADGTPTPFDEGV
jgi:ParB family protein of integrating conjugative element (PFGI_1 class)